MVAWTKIIQQKFLTEEGVGRGDMLDQIHELS